MEFWTTLIKVTNVPNKTAQENLEINCTHVTGRYWIMEGDIDVLRDEGIKLTEIAEGAVGSLAKKSEAQLKKICLHSYGVKL